MKVINNSDKIISVLGNEIAPLQSVEFPENEKMTVSVTCTLVGTVTISVVDGKRQFKCSGYLKGKEHRKEKDSNGKSCIVITRQHNL